MSAAAPPDLASIARGNVDLKLPAAKDGDSSKANRYVLALYDARCSGQWDGVGELARKVDKHAPERRCMTLAGRAGSRIYPNPSPHHFKAAEDEFGEHLSKAVRSDKTAVVDVIDGTVTRAALLLGVGQFQAALSQIPEPLHRFAVPTVGAGVEAWVCICVLQGTLIRGLSLEMLEKTDEAGNTYRGIIGYLSHVVKLPSQCPELRRWVEALLSRICLFFSTRSGHLGEAMAAFHLLSQYLDGQAWRPLASGGIFTPLKPRQVWRAYFETLSKIIREDLVYHPSPLYRDHDTLEHRGLLDDDEFAASRTQQRADLRRVESNYETLLLQETSFPRANETNEEVKSWVELVMGNWAILCGQTWTSQEIGAGPGGKAVVARNTLDVLYRAAGKTFHSTQILRHLFTVHAYLGEFDIAFKAFDTYVDIMTKGKARAEKSGKAGLDLDDDETAIRLASEAIRIACSLGSEATAEKALNIGDTLQKWLYLGSSTSDSNNIREHRETGEKQAEKGDRPILSPEIVSLAYRSIGITQAQYARSTPLPVSRSEMQRKAIENFRHSLQQNISVADRVETHYALSLILAETRDIDGAIENVKQALQDQPEGLSGLGDLNGVHSTNGVKEPTATSDIGVVKRSKFLPLWHLLAQLLCSREAFDFARTCCDLSLDPFGGTSGLLSKPAASSAALQVQNKDLPLPEKSNSKSLDPVDLMDNLEKQVVLEIKMTQLSLSELVDGPESAVNGTNELLALFERLFGNVDFESWRRSKSSAVKSPPKSSSGTMRSVFSRPKSVKKTVPTSQNFSGITSNTNSALTTRPTTSSTVKPAIQVTNPNGRVGPSQTHDHDEKPKHNVLRKKSSSIRRQEVAHGQEHENISEEKDWANGVEAQHSKDARVSFQYDHEGVEQSKEKYNSQTLEPGNLHHNSKFAPPHENGIVPNEEKRLSSQRSQDRASQPVQVLADIQDQTFKASLLIKIWLFVARLYSKVSLFDDAKEAIKEAHKLVSGLEVEVLRHQPSIRHLQDQGWGRGKSVEELWADVFSEEGKLHECQSLPHDALERFEKALAYHPDHPEATVALSNIILDIYCQVIPPEKPDPTDIFASTWTPRTESTARSDEEAPGRNVRPSNANPSPSELSRLACRDRAYGLLSALTRLGSGWDDPEAWYVLARAYEESDQADKAKEALWWTVRLEDTKPIRHWRNVSPGGYVL